MKSSATTRAFVGVLASAAFLWTLVLSVSPQLHVDQFSPISALTPQWVESPFLVASIFEHAPPAHS